MRYLLCVWLLFFFSISGGIAQNRNFAQEMEFALHIHDTASVFESELKAVKAFERVGKKYNNEWLPQYWAAYLYTQIGRLVDRLERAEARMSFIDKAQEKFDLAAKLLPNKTVEDQSSFHALQGLIYLFKSRFSEGTDSKIYAELGVEEVNKAIQTNPNNPLVFVLSATSLIRSTTNLGQDGEAEPDLRKVLAGNILLEKAKTIFERARPDRSMTTHWNQEWLSFWLPYSEKLLKGEAKS